VSGLRFWHCLCHSEALLCESISRPRFSLPSPAQRSLSLSPNCLLLLLILPRLAEGTRLRGRAAILTVQTLKFFDLRARGRRGIFDGVFPDAVGIRDD